LIRETFAPFGGKCVVGLNGTLVNELPLLTIAASPFVEDQLGAAYPVAFDVHHLLRHDVDEEAILELELLVEGVNGGPGDEIAAAGVPVFHVESVAFLVDDARRRVEVAVEFPQLTVFAFFLVQNQIPAFRASYIQFSQMEDKRAIDAFDDEVRHVSAIGLISL